MKIEIAKSEQTNEKIPELYPEPLDADTAMVLASSLYFKGNWKTKFTPRLDDEDLCWFSDEQAVRLDLFSQKPLIYFIDKRGRMLRRRQIHVQ